MILIGSLIAMALHSSFLESLCVICFEVPDTQLNPCSHVLCEECATQILAKGCPLCREAIVDLTPLSAEQRNVVEVMRAEEDRQDEIRRGSRNEAASDIIAQKFLRKKNAHLVPMELLKRIAMQNLEKYITFQGAMKHTMRDGHRIILMKMDKEREERKALKESIPFIEKDSNAQYVIQCLRRGEDAFVGSLLQRISKKTERKRAREVYVSEVRKFSEDLERRILKNPDKPDLHYIEKALALMWINFKHTVRCKFLKLDAVPYTEEEMDQWAECIAIFAIKLSSKARSSPTHVCAMLEKRMENLSNAERDSVTLSEEIQILRSMFDNFEIHDLNAPEEERILKP